MDVAEAMIKYVIRYVMEQCPDEINFFNSFVDKGLKERLEHVASSDFGRVSYTEAVELLKQNNDKFDYKVEWGTDLQTEHERYLTEQIFKSPCSSPTTQGHQGVLYAPQRRRQDRGRRAEGEAAGTVSATGKEQSKDPVSTGYRVFASCPFGRERGKKE